MASINESNLSKLLLDLVSVLPIGEVQKGKESSESEQNHGRSPGQNDILIATAKEVKHRRRKTTSMEKY